jgi:hypothetical protein
LGDSHVSFLLLLGAPNLYELDLHRIVINLVRSANWMTIGDGEPLRLNEILPNPEKLVRFGGVGGGV